MQISLLKKKELHLQMKMKNQKKENQFCSRSLCRIWSAKELNTVDNCNHCQQLITSHREVNLATSADEEEAEEGVGGIARTGG